MELPGSSVPDTGLTQDTPAEQRASALLEAGRSYAEKMHYVEERKHYAKLAPGMPETGEAYLYDKAARDRDRFILDQAAAKRYSGLTTVSFVSSKPIKGNPKNLRYICVVDDTDLGASLTSVLRKLAVLEDSDVQKSVFTEIVYTLLFNHESLNLTGLHFFHGNMTVSALAVKSLDMPERLRPYLYPDVQTSVKVSFLQYSAASLSVSNAKRDFRALGASICGLLASVYTSGPAQRVSYLLFDLGEAGLSSQTKDVLHPDVMSKFSATRLLTAMVNLGPGNTNLILEKYFEKAVPAHLIARCQAQFGERTVAAVFTLAATDPRTASNTFQGQPITAFEHTLLFTLVNHAKLALLILRNIHELGLSYLVSVLALHSFATELLPDFNVPALMTVIFDEAPYSNVDVYSAVKRELEVVASDTGVVTLDCKTPFLK